MTSTTGKKLDQPEAQKLKGIINTEYEEALKDAVILLIAQSMKKKRWTNKTSINSNRFDLLEKVNPKH